jgi:hypothetical protein
MNKIMTKIYCLLTSPEKSWQEIKAEEREIFELLKSAAIPFVILPVLVSFIRSVQSRFYYLSLKYIFDLFLSCLTNYIILLAALLFAAWIVSLLANYFGAKGDLKAACKVVIYSMIPVWLVSVFQLFPQTRILSLLGLYSTYLLFSSLPIVLETPPDKQLGLGASIIGFGLALMMYLSIVIGGVFYY